MTEPPITEKTRAILSAVDKLQDVSNELRQIRRLLENQQSGWDKAKAALKRALNQLLSQL